MRRNELIRTDDFNEYETLQATGCTCRQAATSLSIRPDQPAGLQNQGSLVHFLRGVFSVGSRRCRTRESDRDQRSVLCEAVPHWESGHQFDSHYLRVHLHSGAACSLRLRVGPECDLQVKCGLSAGRQHQIEGHSIRVHFCVQRLDIFFNHRSDSHHLLGIPHSLHLQSQKASAGRIGICCPRKSGDFQQGNECSRDRVRTGRSADCTLHSAEHLLGHIFDSPRFRHQNARPRRDFHGLWGPSVRHVHADHSSVELLSLLLPSARVPQGRALPVHLQAKLTSLY